MIGRDLAGEVKATVIGDRFLELARDLGGNPRKAGVDWRCACFVHGGSGPNLVLTPSSGLWHCMSSCGGGDAIAMVMRTRSVDFVEAVAWLAEWAGIAGSAPSSRADAPERPRAWDTPARVVTAPDARAEGCLASLWSIVSDAPWSTCVALWLSEVRGVEPDAAYALGCRDWSTRRHEIAELVDRTPLDVLEAVGLARDGRLHPAVAGCLRGDPDWAAMAVPVWRLGRAYPERWRWRLIVPWATRGGGTIKSAAPYSVGGVPADLLGVGRPDRLDAPEVRLAWLGSGAPGADLVIIAEGEPDWLAATEVVDGRATVLGVCGSPTRWREGWPSLHDLAALGVRRVAVCVHHGPRAKGRDGRVLGHGERFAEVVAAGCARAGLGYTRKLAAEGEDLNDLHRAGRLRGFVADVLEVNHGR